MSDPVKLSSTQKAQVRILGFCDPAFKFDCDAADDGVVYMRDQTSSYTSLEGYAEAFKNLASLGGRADAIDSSDISKLRNKDALYSVISKDPVLSILSVRKSGLEFNKIEIPRSADGKHVPPRDYRRLTAYLRMALRAVVNPNLRIDGNYGEGMRMAVKSFQDALGIKLSDGKPANGKVLGMGTIGPLLMRLRLGREELLSTLEADRDALLRRGGFFMGDAKGKAQKAAQASAVLAFKWLGYIEESVDIDTVRGRMKAVEALQEKFKEEGDAVGPNMVGPKIMGRIIERVAKVPF
ncbi:MAG TPA: hypothetical protein PLZ86_05040 [bacterium]|nr:hypothetical protein [bacterium]